MLYSKHITFPYGQTANTATKRYFRANRGVIYRVWITFPAGAAGLVKLRLYHEGHPMLPSQKDEYIRGDAITLVYPLFFEILGAPELITIEGWNEDDTYNHEIDVQMLIVPKAWVQPVGAYEGIIAAMKAIFMRRR